MYRTVMARHVVFQAHTTNMAKRTERGSPRAGCLVSDVTARRRDCEKCAACKSNRREMRVREKRSACVRETTGDGLALFTSLLRREKRACSSSYTLADN